MRSQVNLAFVLVLIVAATLVAQDVCSRSDVIFCSDFNGTSSEVNSNWGTSVSSLGQLISDPGPFNEPGNKVCRVTSANTGFSKVFQPGHQKIYARWYYYWEAQSFDGIGHHGGFHGAPASNPKNYMGRSDYRPDGDDWFEIRHEPKDGNLTFYAYYRGMYQDCYNPDGQCWGDQLPCFRGSYCTNSADLPFPWFPKVQTRKWHCIEMMIDAGTPVTDQSQANGEFSLWIDGTLAGTFTNRWVRTSSSILNHVLWFCIRGDGHSVLVDDVVIATEYIGPKATSKISSGSNGININVPLTVQTRTSTTIAYTIEKTSHVGLNILRPNGQLVRTLTIGKKPMGSYRVRWDGMDANGNALSNGLYMCRLQAGTASCMSKVALVR